MNLMGHYLDHCTCSAGSRKRRTPKAWRSVAVIVACVLAVVWSVL